MDFTVGMNRLALQLPEADLSNCASEPIHTPGMIQPHGVLLVARESDLRVVYASANAARVTKIPVEAVLGRSLLDCLSAEVCAEIIRYDDQGNLVFLVARRQCLASGVGARHHVDVHHHHGFVYVEIELEVIEPDTSRLPVRAQVAIDAVRSATSLKELLGRAVRELRELTRYDRVMVYQFVRGGHGYVVAEDRAESMAPFVGLYFPASDIPAQAMKLYLLQRVRVLANSQYEGVPVLCDPELGAGAPPLDMTFCGLRSISPVHAEYVRNMGVGGTLTLSLLVNDSLWGLLVCHQRAPRLPSPELRSTCELLSQIISELIRGRQEAEAAIHAKQRQLALDRIAAAFEGNKSVFECLVTVEAKVLEIVGASGALLRLDGRSHCIGKTPPMDEALDLMTRLRAVEGDNILSSDCVTDLFSTPYPLSEDASGVLMVSNIRNPADGIVWFRPEVTKTLTWGGNPNKPAGLDKKTGRIAPRKSFERWKTLFLRHSTPWCETDIQAAGSLKRIITTHLIRQAERAFSASSLVDSLTMLPNRRGFQEELRAWSERPDRCSAAVILISLDRFKLVNAALGHSSGDDLLLQVARRVTELVEGENISLARLGGDEFAALAPDCTPEEAEELAARIGYALHAPFLVLGKPFRIMASVGLAHTPHGIDELLKGSDTAIHFAKCSSERYMSFDRLLERTAVQGMELEQDLHLGLERNEFVVVYQPLVTLPEAEVIGFEALVRWNHPTRGTISPLDFIPMAEETGLIVPIGKRVLTEAIRYAKKWRDASVRPLRIHVNVAPKQLTSGFATMVEMLLLKFDLGTDALSIEVTESTLMRDVAVDTLRELRSLGIQVSVDDFGTGYSSLSYLRHLPVDTVKIDRSFVHPMVEDQRSNDFVGVILQLTEKLGLNAIAEGVETDAQRRALSALGCPLAQGYLFSKPLTSTEVSQLLDSCNKNRWMIGEPRVRQVS